MTSEAEFGHGWVGFQGYEGRFDLNYPGRFRMPGLRFPYVERTRTWDIVRVDGDPIDGAYPQGRFVVLSRGHDMMAKAYDEADAYRRHFQQCAGVGVCEDIGHPGGPRRSLAQGRSLALAVAPTPTSANPRSVARYGGRTWWVNQGQSFDPERRGGYMWAPVESHGRRLPHWDSMTEVSVGDQVIHYARGVRALSTVTGAAIDTLKPHDLPDAWPKDGRLVRCAYSDALRPVSLEEIPEAWRLAVPGGPFRADGKVNQGYLYPLSDEFAKQFMARFGQRFDLGSPSVALPAEALETATDLLRRLIGVPISTIDGSPNRVLRVTPPDVVVATTRSPGGSPVPIAEVQQALERLRNEGSVTIHPSEVGYRSAFVGAVLLTLPGAHAAGSPPVIRIDPAAPELGTALTFDGDLDRPRDAAERGEQASLRRVVLGNATRARCAICGEEFPVVFLHAAHIKRRSACSDAERRDLGNVAMPACVFGCDALYEHGFVAVGADGRIEVAAAYLDDPALGPRLRAVNGRRCESATSGRQGYYEWHRTNVFRGTVEPLADVHQAGSPRSSRD